MKRLILILSALIFSAAALSAQDLITKRNGEDIVAKVLEITPDEVKYRLYDEPDGPVYTVRKSELLLIRHASGRNEIFNNTGFHDSYAVARREPVSGLSAGMKYKGLKPLYNYWEYTPSAHDRFSPAWSGVASFFIPGLGQMVCDEVGRGLAWLGGAAGCTLVAGIGTAVGMAGYPSGAILSLAASAGSLALNICSIVDAVRIAKVKNMYEQDLKSAYTLDVNLYPSVNCIQTASGIQPAAGLTLAMRF